jgi:hypothetical protein
MLRLAECYRGGFEGRPGFWMKFKLSTVGHDPEEFSEGIAAIKATVPAGERSFEPEALRWWIADEWAGELTGVIAELESHLRQRALPGFGR